MRPTVAIDDQDEHNDFVYHETTDNGNEKKRYMYTKKVEEMPAIVPYRHWKMNCWIRHQTYEHIWWILMHTYMHAMLTDTSQQIIFGSSCQVAQHAKKNCSIYIKN